MAHRKLTAFLDKQLFPNKSLAFLDRQELFRDQQLTVFLDRQLFPNKFMAFLDKQALFLDKQLFSSKRKAFLDL